MQKFIAFFFSSYSSLFVLVCLFRCHFLVLSFMMLFRLYGKLCCICLIVTLHFESLWFTHTYTHTHTQVSILSFHQIASFFFSCCFNFLLSCSFIGQSKFASFSCSPHILGTSFWWWFFNRRLSKLALKCLNSY